MKLSGTTRIILIIMIFSTPLLSLYIRSIHAVLYENGTCANDNVTKVSNQSINRNESMDRFLENLTSDNRQLAELMCQYILTEQQ
jgi:hypothetical protein